MGVLLVYVWVMFVLGAVESMRYGLLLAFLSAVVGSVAIVSFQFEGWQMFATQVGLFLAIFVLRLLASVLRPSRVRPAQVSGTHRDADASASATPLTRGLLAMLVFVVILVAPFMIAAYVLGPIEVSQDTWMFFMLTGAVGIALVLSWLLPLLVPLLAVATWTSGRILNDGKDE